MMQIATLGALILIAGCAKTPAPRLDEAYERSTHQLALTPEAAVSCIVHNAARAGYMPKARMLFSMETIGVIVQTADRAEDIFSAIVERAGTGSRMTVRSIAAHHNRKQLTEGLLKGC